jgi:hypothetical protein
MAYVQSKTGSHTGTEVFTITMTTTPANGNKLIAIATDDTNTSTITPPSGFTLYATELLSGPDTQTIKHYYKDVGAGEVNSYSWQGSAGHVQVIMAEFSGRATGAPSTSTAVLNTSSNASPISCAITGLTAVSGDDLIATVGLDQVNQTEVWSFSGPSGFTSRATISPGDWGTLYMATLDNSTAGATGTKTVTATRTGGSGNAGWAGLITRLPSTSSPAATLSSPAFSSSTATSVTGTVSSNTAGGTMYAAVTNTSATPTSTQIETGGGNVVARSNATAVSGTNTLTVTGLTASTSYWLWFVQDNGSVSNIPASVSFTTPAPTAAVLSTPAVSTHDDISVTGTVSSDRAEGTLYAAVTNTSATPTSTQIETGGGNVVARASAAAASGTNTLTVTGLTASTSYWLWFVQDNGSVSNIPTSVAFTTSVNPTATLSSPAVQSTSATTVTGTVTSNLTRGTLYAAVTNTSATPTSTQIETGGGNVVARANITAASGTNTITVTGLSASTNYWLWFIQDNGNISNIPAGTSFTTAAQTYAYVGGASTATSASNSTSLTLTYSPTAGNSLFLTVAYDNSSQRTITSLVDQSSNPITYSLVGQLQDSPSYQGLAVLYCPTVGSGITGITVSLSSGTGGIGLDAREYSYLSGITTLAGSKTASATFTTATDAVTTGSIVPTGAPGICFAVAGDITAAATPAAGTGYTSRAADSFAMHFGTSLYRIEDARYTTTGGTTPTFTSTGASGNSFFVIAAMVQEQQAAATLTSPTLASHTDVSATGTISSNEAGGTVYAAITNTNAAPTAAQVKAGGGNVVAHNSVTAVSGTNSVTITGLTASTTYYGPWFVQTNGTGADSSVVGLSTSFTTNPPSPSISSLSSTSPTQGSTLTITLINGGATQGTVTLGGVTQSVTSWSATSIQITVDVGTNAYGTALNLIVTSSAGWSSSPYSVSGGVQPVSGWAYINLLTLNSTSSMRLTAIPDITAGDQLLYDTKSGLVTVRSDGSFAADSTVTSFGVKAWSSGKGWGYIGTQTLL